MQNLSPGNAADGFCTHTLEHDLFAGWVLFFVSLPGEEGEIAVRGEVFRRLRPPAALLDFARLGRRGVPHGDIQWVALFDLIWYTSGA